MISGFLVLLLLLRYQKRTTQQIRTISRKMKSPLRTWVNYFCIWKLASAALSSYNHFLTCIFFKYLLYAFFRYLLCAFFRIIYIVGSLNCDFFFFKEIMEKIPTIQNEEALIFYTLIHSSYVFWPGTSAPTFFFKRSWKFSSIPLPDSRN